MALIELSGLRRSYRVDGQVLDVLRDVTLEIAEGEFVAIVGPSGSGKSTLLQILGLLDRPTAGVYRLLGRDVSRLTDDEGAALRASTIGFVFQMFNLLPRTTARENVELPMVYAHRPGRRARAEALLDRVGLSHRREHRPNQLSGGQQQRVAIARALANGPRVIFADEPTGNLASDQAEEILALLEELHRAGHTLIVVTHEPDIAARAERVLRIKDGRVVADERRRPPRTPAPPTSEAPVADGPAGSRWREFASSAVRVLWANKARSGLSMLGILIGVASVIVMLALGRGAQKAVEQRLSSLGSNLVLLTPGAPSSGGVRGEAGAASRLTPEDVKAIARVSPHVKAVDGNVNGAAQVVAGARNTHTQVYGATPVYETMRAARPYYGRFFTEAENAAEARVALLGQTVVNALFGRENPVGQTVKINRVNYRVIGVLPVKGAGGFRDQDDMVLVPLATAMNRVLGKKHLNAIAVECDDPATIEPVMAEVRALMRRRHRLPAHREDDFNLRNMADIQQALAGTTQTFTLLLGAVAAISLLVGGIGIMNIMLVSVSERTREIGLRKAVGAARWMVLSQFLIEAAILSSLGGAAGVALGGAAAVAASAGLGWAAQVTARSVAIAAIFSVGTGIVFGFWPARKASLLSPIEALRYE